MFKPLFLINLLILINQSLSDHDGSTDPLDWLRNSVPGEPGVDYPVLAEVQETSFTCNGKLFGGNFIWIHFQVSLYVSPAI